MGFALLPSSKVPLTYIFQVICNPKEEGRRDSILGHLLCSSEVEKESARVTNAAVTSTYASRCKPNRVCPLGLWACSWLPLREWGGGGQSLGSGGFAWGRGLLVLGGPTVREWGDSWGSFVQCVLWVLLGTPSSIDVGPCSNPGRRVPSPPTSLPVCSPQMLTL